MKNEKEFGRGVKDVEAMTEDPRVFAKLTFDKGFKIVFGTEGKSERILKSLLNHLLDMKIVDLTFSPTEKHGMTEEDAESRFDVYCKDRYGRRFLVEMQMKNQPHFNKRAVYYSSFAVQDQARDARNLQKEAGDKWDYDFEPIYVISFLNSKNNLSEDPNNEAVNPYISHYIYRSKMTGKALEDDTNLIFIDLYRFRKTFEECESDFERWMFSIKNMHKLSEFPTGIDGTELEELYDEAKLAAWKPELRTKYEILMGNKHDWEVSTQYELKLAKAAAREEGLAEGRAEGRTEGLAEGRAEGRAEGEANKALQIAKNMLDSDLDVSLIAKVTGLSEEEINSLT